MERGETFIPGMKVSWIVTNSRKSPQEVEPYIDGSVFEFKPDWEYYARRVEETLDRVLEGIGEEYGIGKNSQANLMEFTGEKKREADSAKRKDSGGSSKPQSNLFQF